MWFLIFNVRGFFSARRRSTFDCLEFDSSRKIETKKTASRPFFSTVLVLPLHLLVSVGRLDFRVLVGQPVGQVEDDEDRWGDPHGPQVDVVAGLLDLARHTLLEIHLGQGGLCGVGVQGVGWGWVMGGSGRERKKNEIMMMIFKHITKNRLAKSSLTFQLVVGSNPIGDVTTRRSSISLGLRFHFLKCLLIHAKPSQFDQFA